MPNDGEKYKPEDYLGPVEKFPGGAQERIHVTIELGKLPPGARESASSYIDVITRYPNDEHTSLKGHRLREEITEREGANFQKIMGFSVDELLTAARRKEAEPVELDWTKGRRM